MAAEEDLVIWQGKTFEFVLRWEVLPIVYKAITAISKAAPCVVTAAGHGVPEGWRVAVVSTLGMDELKAAKQVPKDSEYHRATVLTANTVELNDVNAADYTAYVSGGYLQYNTPADLTGFTARMTIKNRVGGTELLALTTANSRIAIDTVDHTITLTVSAEDTEAITWASGVYDLELVSSTDVVTPLMFGAVAVTNEVTT